VSTRVVRYHTPDELADGAAGTLLGRIRDLQDTQGRADLCLTGGRVANRMYESLADQFADSGIDPTALHLWWGDERFVGLTDPDRNALQSLSILARTLHVPAAQIHPMPGKDGRADPGDAAYAYAQELGDTVFDICLLGMGPDGHVASIFPDHPSFDPTTATVIGVTDAPKPPSERISLTLNALNRSKAIWIVVTGEEKADAVAKALSGDWFLPAARVHGTEETLLFLDAEAAALLPRFNCLL
jgi:6-phosphogluconolactonase